MLSPEIMARVVRKFIVENSLEYDFEEFILQAGLIPEDFGANKGHWTEADDEIIDLYKPLI